MNFFYVFIVFGPILRHLGELGGKIRLLPGENRRFFPEIRIIRGDMTEFQFFLFF